MNTAQKTLLKQQIHNALFEMFEHRVRRDNDGDWPVGVGNLYVYVRMEDSPAPHALVFTRAATGVARDCVGELHDLNVAAAWAKFSRTDNGDVFVTQRVHQHSITAAALAFAIEGVATCAHQCGPMLQVVHSQTNAADAERD